MEAANVNFLASSSPQCPIALDINELPGQESIPQEIESTPDASDMKLQEKNVYTAHSPSSWKVEGESSLHNHETPRTPIADRYSVPNYIADKNRIIDDEVILKRKYMNENKDIRNHIGCCN